MGQWPRRDDGVRAPLLSAHVRPHRVAQSAPGTRDAAPPSPPLRPASCSPFSRSFGPRLERAAVGLTAESEDRSPTPRLLGWIQAKKGQKAPRRNDVTSSSSASSRSSGGRQIIRNVPNRLFGRAYARFARGTRVLPQPNDWCQDLPRRTTRFANLRSRTRAPAVSLVTAPELPNSHNA